MKMDAIACEVSNSKKMEILNRYAKTSRLAARFVLWWRARHWRSLCSQAG
jgi:hypothetical protein